MAKDTFYFSHDFSSRNDPKLQELQMVHGMAGIGIFWCLVEMLHEQDGYLILSQCKSYAFALRVDCDLIKSLVLDFSLFKNDGERFWSESALQRIQERKAKSKKAKASADSRWKNANAMRTHSEGNAIKEIKGKESKVKEKPITTIIPSTPTAVFKTVEDLGEDCLKDTIHFIPAVIDRLRNGKGYKPAKLKEIQAAMPDLMKEFIAHLRSEGYETKDVAGFRSHFKNWICKRDFNAAPAGEQMVEYLNTETAQKLRMPLSKWQEREQRGLTGYKFLAVI